MQNHALSIARHAIAVDIIGYVGMEIEGSFFGTTLLLLRVRTTS